MYAYDELDRTIVNERVSEFRDQVARRLSGELTEDAIAYLEIGTQPRAQTASTEARQVFKGWMFASSPSVSGLQHPVYDAWVVGCKA